jgi:hypothetical protein
MARRRAAVTASRSAPPDRAHVGVLLHSLDQHALRCRGRRRQRQVRIRRHDGALRSKPRQVEGAFEVAHDEIHLRRRSRGLRRRHVGGRETRRDYGISFPLIRGHRGHRSLLCYGRARREGQASQRNRAQEQLTANVTRPLHHNLRPQQCRVPRWTISDASRHHAHTLGPRNGKPLFKVDWTAGSRRTANG